MTEQEILDRAPIRVEGSTEDSHDQIGVAVGVQISHGRRVVAAGENRVAPREGYRVPGQVGTLTASGVLDQQQTGLEEVAPEHVRVSVVVHVPQRERIRSMQAAQLGDDLDILKSVGDQPEPRGRRGIGGSAHSGRRTRRRNLLVPGHRPGQPADEQIHETVAIHVARIGYVLPIREDGSPGSVSKRVGPDAEPAVVVPPQPHVTEGGLAEQIRVSVPVHVGESIPLPDLEAGKPVGAPFESRPVTPARVFEVDDAPGSFLDEQVGIAVAIDVRELRSGLIEAPQPGMFVRDRVEILYRRPQNPTHETLSLIHISEPTRLLVQSRMPSSA